MTKITLVDRYGHCVELKCENREDGAYVFPKHTIARFVPETKQGMCDSDHWTIVLIQNTERHVRARDQTCSVP